MICQNCGTEYEGYVCPNCGRTSAAPNESVKPEPHNNQNTIAFVILALGGGVLALGTIGVLLLGVSSNTVRNTRISEQPAIERSVQQTYPTETYDPEADKAAKNAWQQKKGIYESGEYAVGEDIPAGTYIILSDGLGYGDFYTGIYAAPSMSDESEIYGGWAKNSRYVILEEGQYLHFSHSTLYDPELVDVTLDPFSQSGMFLVGRDLAPGTYTVVPDNDQYGGTYEVYSVLTSSGAVTKFSNYLDTNNGEEVTLKEGEYILTDFCILKE